MSLCDLKQKLAVLEGIPTLPVFVRDLVLTIDTDEFTMGDIEKIVRQDPAISSRLLKVANSSFFGFSGQVTTLQRAILLLGTHFVKALALGMSILDCFSLNQTLTKDEWHDYWLHSFSCGWVSRRLTQHGLFSEESNEAFLAGLLHDLGKPVLWIYETNSYQEVKLKIRDQGLSTHEAEREIFGMHHGEVGGELAAHWQFPSSIQGAILEHHEVKPTLSSACLVKVADSVVHNVRSSNRYRKTHSMPLDNIAKEFCIKPGVLWNVVKEVELWGHEIRELARSLEQIGG